MNSDLSRKLFKGKGLAVALLATGGSAFAYLLHKKSVLSISAKQTAGGNETSKSDVTDVYMWGNGQRTVRSEYLGQYNNFQPTRILSFDATKNICFKTIVIGEGNEGGIDHSGRLFVWNPKTQLSYLDKTANEFETRDNLQLIANNVKQAAFNRLGLWILLESGSIEFRPVFIYKNPAGEIIKGDFLNKKLEFN